MCPRADMGGLRAAVMESQGHSGVREVPLFVLKGGKPRIVFLLHVL